MTVTPIDNKYNYLIYVFINKGILDKYPDSQLTEREVPNIEPDHNISVPTHHDLDIEYSDPEIEPDSPNPDAGIPQAEDETQELFDTIWGQIIIQCQINDNAAKLIEKCFSCANREGIVPRFEKLKKARLEITKFYSVYTNCNWIKEDDVCLKCNTETGINTFAIFNIEAQLNQIF